MSLKASYKVLKNTFYMKMWNASWQKIKYIYLEETGSTNTSDHGGHLHVHCMSRPSNFKGQVVTQGGECHKYALWLKPWLQAFMVECQSVLSSDPWSKNPSTSQTIIQSNIRQQSVGSLLSNNFCRHSKKFWLIHMSWLTLYQLLMLTGCQSKCQSRQI